MWQALRFEERCRLCAEEPDATGVEAYAALIHALAEGRPGQLSALPALPNPRPWVTEEAKARVMERSRGAGRPLSAEAWGGLGDEARYVLWRLSEVRRSPEKLLAALAEFL